jgi:hypothetical protein
MVSLIFPELDALVWLALSVVYLPVACTDGKVIANPEAIQEKTLMRGTFRE